MSGLIAVIDIGKTNAKLILFEDGTGAAVWSVERPSPAIPVPGFGDLARQLDVHGIEAWLIAQLARAPDRHRIRAIVPVAHGAAMVLVDAEGETLLAPDYEDGCFDRLSAQYRAVRPPYKETLSPALPVGLNLGAQIFFVQEALPEIFLRTRTILTYPQYWSWRLSGVAASEVTSLGCHSDLWNPAAQSFSKLVLDHGWGGLMPPLRPARAVLGTLRQEVAEATGLSPDCAVICGIHDSNASYLSHRVARGDVEPFSVISSGTWCIVLAYGADLARLREAEDMLANVDALGVPTATARFMGGREYATIAGEGAVPPTAAGLTAVLAADAVALPSFALGGPCQGRRGQVLRAEELAPEGRAALATFYCALMADLILDRLGVAGAILVDGPFAANPLFSPVLQSLRPTDPVTASGTRGGITAAVLWLAGAVPSPEPTPKPLVALVEAEALRAYRDRWRAMISA
jgi:L-fuculokinase